MSTFASVAQVPTKNGGKYLQQLAKHWSHNLQVEYGPEHAIIVFPRDARGAQWPADGKVMMRTTPVKLECTIEASHPGQLDGLKGALSRHLDRFAFKEAPLHFDWQDQ